MDYAAAPNIMHVVRQEHSFIIGQHIIILSLVYADWLMVGLLDAAVLWRPGFLSPPVYLFCSLLTDVGSIVSCQSQQVRSER